MQTHPIENQETNTNTPLNKPKEKYKHILEQAKRQIQKHLRPTQKQMQTHPIANQETNTNTP